MGVACSLMIALYVLHEMSYDKFHEKADNIYRLNRDIKVGENYYHFAFSPAPVASFLVEEIPEVKKAVRLRNIGSFLVKRPEMSQSFKETRLICADSGFFDLFSFQLLEGNPSQQLKAPNTIVLSQKIADKYFKNESALNKSLILNGDETYKITGVFEEMPENSHIQFDFLISMSSIPDQASNSSWTSNNFYTYYELRDDANLQNVIDKINQKSDAELAIVLNTMMNGKTLEEFKAEGGTMDFFMQPLEDVYLQSDFTVDIGRMGNQNYVILFGIIAVFIIILASINFMNLSTARSANRGKEVGVRKVLGSHRSNLVGQFLTESILLSVFSFLVGLFLVVLLLPFFNDLTDKQLVLPLASPAFIGIMLLSSLAVGVLAGLYPSFYLSAFNPVETLKGKLSTGSGNSTVRSGLVVFQFFISILLMSGTVAIHKQLQFIQNRNIGFEKDQVILLNDPYMLGDKTTAFKEEIKMLPNVVSASYSGFIPVSGYNRTDNTYWPVGQEAADNNLVGIQMWRVDPDYVSTMGMKVIDGRDFNQEIASDSSGVILNERAFEMFGFKKGEDNAIQTNAFDDSNNLIEGQYEQHKVLGVVEDFNFESMKENIGPLALFIGRSTSSLVIKLQSDEMASTLANIEAKWNEFDSSLPFSYTFLDEEFANMYKAELKLAQVFSIFAGLAIFIGCLGLFALASFMAEQRAKEIGIRKVLGASVNGIVLLLSKQFSRLVVLAFLLALPLAWWGISQWLEGYNYRINISWELFAIAGISAFLIAWLTVAYHSIKSAISNPVKSLKSE